MLRAIIFDFNKTLYSPDSGNLFPGVKDLLSELKTQSGLTLGLISYGGDYRVKLIEGLGILSLFDWFKFVEEKSTEDFLEFSKKFQILPRSILVVGDMLEEEIKIAKFLTMKTAWIKNSFQGESSIKPDYQLNSVSEIRELISLF